MHAFADCRDVCGVWQTASWYQRNIDEGSAVGGNVMMLDGYGFNNKVSDYVCKFVSVLDPTRVAQSYVPAKPSGPKTLSCTTPRWPYDARGAVGQTELYLEKGGLPIEFTGDANQKRFTFGDQWNSLSHTQTLATYASETLVVSGAGFQVGSTEYSCEFQTVPPNIKLGVAGTVVSSKAIECITPHWKHKGALTNVRVYKQNCAGARGIADNCITINVVQNPNEFKELTFVQAARNMSINTALASRDGTTIITVYGGGFDATMKNYAVEWRVGNDSVKINVNGTRTAYSLELFLPQWAYTPNQLAHVTLFAGSVPVANSFDSTMTFMWESSWSSFVDEAPVNAGTSAGGELVTIIGQGFAVNATQSAATYLHGVGVDNDYACKFTDDKGFYLLSERVEPVSRTQIVCTTPAWGMVQVGVKTTVTLVKGAYEYPGQSVDFTFLSSWQTLSATSGPVGGGVLLTINGVGFNASKTFQCKFSYNNDELFAYTSPVLPLSANQVVFTTPRWPSWQEGRTKLIVYEGGVEVLQIVDGGGALATYEFTPAFVVSESNLDVETGDEAYFTFYPDTSPTGTVAVTIISNDTSVAAVSSPYTMDAASEIEDNTRKVSVRCLRPGAVSLALASDGANYGAMYLDQVFVRCRASIQIDKDSASMTRGSATNLRINLDPRAFTGNVSVTVTSSDNNIFVAQPSLLIFQNYTTRTVQLQCIGVGKADLLLQVVSDGGNFLYANVARSFPVYGMPGYILPVTSVNIFPGSFAEIELAPDTPSSLKVDFVVQVADSKVVTADEKLYFPAMRTAPKKFKIYYTGPGTTTVNVIGRSPGMLQQVSVGCSTPDAIRCSEKFVQFGCNFEGSNLTGGDSTWNATMNNVSSASGVTDCRLYRGCFRAACCNSPAGQQCTSALLDASCNLYKVVPELSATEDATYDFGAVPADMAKADLLYKTWAKGVDCQPYVPCAWSQCFPGPGNFESVTSRSVIVTALPGFELSPSPMNLHQGRPIRLRIALQSVPTGAVNAMIHLVDADGNVAINPSAHVFPKNLVFTPNELVQNVTVQWLRPGRLSLRLVADKDSNIYSNVTHFFEDVISSSPGFKFTQFDPTSDKGELKIKNGVPSMYIRRGQNFEITVKPDFERKYAIDVQAVQDPSGPLNMEVNPSSMRFQQNSMSANKLTVSSTNSGETTLHVKKPGAPSGVSALHVLSSGVGYSSGTLTLKGYGGTGFAAAYTVGVVGWDFYADPVLGTAAVGENYSFHGYSTFQVNQSSPFKVAIGSCFRAAEPLLHADGTGKITGHTGVMVKGCSPQINANISSGKLTGLAFDSTSCLATGITCQLSLNAYGGTGFRGFFQTGIASTAISSTGSGYTCNWACFVSIISSSGLVSVPSHGKLGHAQTCPVAEPTCLDGFSASASLVYGDVRDVEADIRVFAFASATITADISVLRQTQTATITVLPLEIPTGNVTFSVTASTNLLQLTDFRFSTGATSLQDAARTFTVTHMGGGSSRAKVSIYGVGTGNFDGFAGSIEIDLLPGFNVSVDAFKLQLYPGYFIVKFGPDSPPNKDTEVKVHVSTDFGKDILLDSYGAKLLNVAETLVMPAGSVALQDLRVIHGGFGAVKMRNRVAGTATITFSVSDPSSNYDGIGIDGPTKTIAVDVKPGFESNIQDTYMRYLQADSLFPLTISLDQATTQAINISARSANETIAKVSPQVTVLGGQVGPVYFYVEHQGILGETYISLKVDTPGGNYDAVTGVDYMKVVAVPGLTVSSKFIHLQYVRRVETVEVGLDTKPDADVEISLSSSDPHIVGVTSSITFRALEWTPNTRQTIMIMWHGVGDVYIQCVCKSPGGNYNQVYRTDLVKVHAYRPLKISRTKVRIQKYGSGEFSVSTAVKPQKDIIFTVMSSPPGIVDVSGPYLIRPGTNDTFVVNMSHIRMGSATVRVFASSPGDIYDGVAADVQVSTMPGFDFSQQEILLYSCPRTSQCVKTFTFAPEIAPTADVTVTITSSDNTIATVHPSVVTLAAANGTQSTLPVTVSYVSSGSVCLSFAATSVGNYDLVYSGGVTVITLPDFIVENMVITPKNGGQSHGILEFDGLHPIIYVQKGSFSTFDVRPTVVPKGVSVIHIHNPRPDLVEVTSSVVFNDGDTTAKTVTVTHKAVGNVRLSLLGEGGVYDRAAWEAGILVKALPSLELSTEDTSIRYRYAYDFIVGALMPLVDLASGSPSSVRLDVSVEDPGSLVLNTPSIILNATKNGTITVTHSAIFSDPANPFDGTTRLSIRAYGPDTNYHHVESIILLTLDFPGFSASTKILHVQRWAGSALVGNISNTLRGTARVFLTPDEAPDSDTTINFQSTSEQQPQCSVASLFCPVESEEYVNAQTKTIADRNKLVWSPYANDGRSSKFIQATHEGAVRKVEIVPLAPAASTWPAGAAYFDASGEKIFCLGQDTCPGSLKAVYAGLIAYLPKILIYNHAGFQAPKTQISVQRQSSGKFEMKLDTIPLADTTVYFTSSDPSIVSVQESAYFFQGEDFAQNISVFAVNPGVAYISFRSTSDEFDYDGAEALRVITITAMKGIGLSKLLIHLQSPPTEDGKATFTIFPDTNLDYSLTVGITSSNTAQVTCTPSVSFAPGPVIPQTVTLTHIAAGSIDNPVKLSFSVSTNAASEYSQSKILPSTVIPLGSFLLSQTTIRVQKARTSVLTIAPNVPPDEDVEVFITVGDTSVVTATTSITFNAKKMDPVPFTLYHVGAGNTKLSFNASSIAGNYFGAYLSNAVQVEALHGFEAWTRVLGVTEAVPDTIITNQQLLVQSQPTSHLSYAHFLVTTDIIPDEETVVVVKSSDDGIVTSSSNVTFQAGVKEYKAVTVVHGGRSGIANIYFSATSAVTSGNYNGLESGDVKVKAAPGFVFSSTSVNVQQNEITNITIRPDLEPTADVMLTIVGSDPSVINVTEKIIFTVSGGVGPKNNKIISIGYEGFGTAALSFFAQGGNFEGVIYSNAVVASSRPGFIISESLIDIPYDGSYTVTVQADTVPTDDAVVTVSSSQPAKAAPTVTSFLLRAGYRDVLTLTIKSYCSVSPGNCARAGKAIIGLTVRSPTGSGNYDGVELPAAVTATVSAPLLLFSTTALYVQSSPGYATFTVAPTTPLNKDTTVSFESLDAGICSAPDPIVFLKDASNEENTKTVSVAHVSVGQTYVRVSIKEPLDSNYVNIDPVLVYVRTLATLTLEPSRITLQPLTSHFIKVFPKIEIDSVLTVNIDTTDSSVLTVTPSSLTFVPPQNLIGSGVNVRVGLRVLLAEKFQVFPRLGVGTIVKILNDNLDLVAVDWDSGLSGQEYAVGKGGEFMLAQYEDLTQTIRISHVHYGDASVFLKGHALDVNYNGLDFQDAVVVHATPSFVCSSTDMVLQYQMSTNVNVLPRIPPSSDISVQVRVVTVGEHEAGVVRASSDIVQVTPMYFEMYRVDGTGAKNERVLTFFCAKTGSVQIEFEGTGGNYDDVLYHPIQIRCLPGLLVSPTVTPILASPSGSFAVTIRPNVVPTERVTIVVTASKPGVVRHTLRLYFEPFVEGQAQELAIEHAGGFFDDDCKISLQGYGGNFDGVDVPAVIHARIARPDLLVPQRSVSVQPNTFTTFPVYFDTFPSAGTYITATSSDTSRATINGPLLVYDTSPQYFTVTHIAPGATTITFSLSALQPGSTYSNVTLPSSLSVAVAALGSGFIVSASQVNVLQGTPQTITIGPDAVPNSRVELTVETVPAGIVDVSPSVVYFEQGKASQYATFTLTWQRAGDTVINVKSMGGNFQSITRNSFVSINALPTLPAAPLMVQSTSLVDKKLQVNFVPPSTDAELITGYFVEISDSSTFTNIILSSELTKNERSAVFGPLIRGVCYFYRVTARNRAGLGAKANGPSCSGVFDSPSAVREVAVKTISEEAVLLQWLPPTDSGDGSGDGIPILRYTVQVRLEDGALSEQISSPADRRSAVLRITPGISYTVHINTVTPVSETQPHSAGLLVAYSGAPLIYDVPLRFVFSTTSVIAPVGASTSVLITPVTPPYLDAIVHVATSNDQSASATPKLIFKKGAVNPQYVIITHTRKGVTLLTFTPEGGYFEGFETVVTVETLASE